MSLRPLRLTRPAVALLLVGAAVILFVALRPGPTRAAAALGPGGATCGAIGTYGYTGTGYTYDGNALGFPTGNVSTNGTLTVDKDGKVTISEWEVVNSTLITSTGPATYEAQMTINPSDCTFTGTIGGSPALVGVIVDNGNQIRAMSIIPGVQVSYISTEKVHLRTGGNSQQ